MRWILLAGALLASCSDRNVEVKDIGSERRLDFGEHDRTPPVDQRLDNVRPDVPRDLGKDQPFDQKKPDQAKPGDLGAKGESKKPDIIVKDGAKITSSVDILVVVDNSI